MKNIRIAAIGRILPTASPAILLIRAVAAFVPLVVVCGMAMGQTETILHSFGGGTDGINPWAGMIFDTQGNLYGTTIDGGTGGCGVAYQLTASNGWNENIIYDNPCTYEVIYPGLTLGPAGNLYGITWGGTVFELRSYKSGDWEKKILLGTNDFVNSSMTFDPRDGGFYSTSLFTVYRIADVNKVWQKTLLYTFSGDGSGSQAPAILDGFGNVYVSSSADGAYGLGTVTKFTKGSNGEWSSTILYSFTGGADGASAGSIVLDPAGNIYGATFGGGPSNVGTIFKLTPHPGGKWTETVLHRFTGGNDGAFPVGGIIFGSDGSLYGTTQMGGGGGTCQNGNQGLFYCGTVFKLSPPTTLDQPWTETILHAFVGGSNDGTSPTGTLVTDARGNLYGTTYGGGALDSGTAFEIMP